MSDAPAGSPATPPGIAPKPSATRQRRERPGPRRGKPWVWLVALALFAGFAIAFFGKKPERVTHAEALEIAARLERAKTAADFRPLLAVRLPTLPEGATEPVPTDVSDPLAEHLAAFANRATIAFLRVDLDDRGRRTLLLRIHRKFQLLDYVRVLLERTPEGPRATEYYQLTFGGWLHESLPMDHAVPTLRAAIAADDIGRWPPAAQRSAAFASAQLAWLVDHELKTFPLALERFRASFPRNPAADFVIATRWLTLALRPEDAITAFDRVQEDHFDPDFLGQLRERVWK
ncbi:MAG: hypothetical protein JNK15_13060 [Planctomycetes bacterium]|nr:hypothetical protein [Planctomycetota bacterium]